ncbi:hypothetical protein HDU87_007500 [Geranomyces variabilis]|uniref:Histone deacetylase 8 n=1 Tax=Geranomyces variabilis TaxID=109894 RepID=A0AAD5XPV9_9FUNG|nr:hypothetical protein HDU87_007500 [Geranomyces variabilis]
MAITARACKVGYVYSHELRALSDLLPSNRMRSTFVHSLIAAYKLVEHMTLIPPLHPTCADFCLAHSKDYVNFLLSLDSKLAKGETPSEADLERFGLEHDCAPFVGVSRLSAAVVGATLAAARALIADTVDVAICWDGGRHHAFRDRASGFCYANDIVVGIIELQRQFPRVLYLDLDIHHGDGVETAFRFSPRVYTCSFHLHDVGFFPATGGADAAPWGKGKGVNHALNVPFRPGLRTETFLRVLSAVLTEIYASFQPQCVVIQCGSDGVHGNLGARGEGWNLDTSTFAEAIAILQGLETLPLLILGGGGYHNPTTARSWAAATAAAIRSCPIPRSDDDVPEHALWAEYARGSGIGGVGSRADQNDEDSVAALIERFASVEYHTMTR